MTRLTRLSIKDTTHYVILSGRKDRPLTPRMQDLDELFNIFGKLTYDYAVEISGYVILPNQLHFMLTPRKDAKDLSTFVQSIARLYCRYYNKSYKKEGTIWQGRYASSVVQGSERIFKSLIYMEWLPELMRIQEAVLYPWSSYHHHAGLRNDYFMTPCSEYWKLGNTPYERQKVYKKIFSQGCSPSFGQNLIRTVKRGWPLADDKFLEEHNIQKSRIAPLRGRGRPKISPAK